MSVTDVWADWSTTAADNSPAGTATCEIDDEFRNIKAQCKTNLLALGDAQTITAAKTFNTGTLKVQSTSAGYLKNSTAGVVTYGEAIAAADLPTGIDAAKIADGTVSNAEFQYLGGCTADIQTQLGAAAGKHTGDVVQQVFSETGAVQSITGVIAADDTIPQNTEGDEWATLAITPTNASNYLLIEVVLNLVSANANNYPVAALFQDATANALACSLSYGAAVIGGTIVLKHRMAAGTTSATTFKVRVGVNSGTATVNGVSGTRWYGGVLMSSITITEIMA